MINGLGTPYPYSHFEELLFKMGKSTTVIRAGSAEPAIEQPRYGVRHMAPSRGKYATVTSRIVPYQARSCSNATGKRSLDDSHTSDCILTTGRSLTNLGSTITHIEMSYPTMPLPTPLLSSQPVSTTTFPCQICGRSFPSNRSRASHQAYCLQRSSQDPYDIFPCDLCDRDFHTKKGLSNHRTHCLKKHHTFNCPSLTSQHLGLPHQTNTKMTITSNNYPDTEVYNPDNDGFGSPTIKGHKTKVPFFNTSAVEIQTWIHTTESGIGINADSFQESKTPDNKEHFTHERLSITSPVFPPSTSPPILMSTQPLLLTPVHSRSTPNMAKNKTHTAPLNHTPTTKPHILKIINSHNLSHSSSTKPETLSQLVSTSRKNQDWYDAQSITDPSKCVPPSDIVMKDRFMFPKLAEEWKHIDGHVVTLFDEQVASQQPDSTEEELMILKETLYNEFSSKFGFKSNICHHSKKKIAISEEKKILRSKKKASRKEFKQLRREGADDVKMRSKHLEWRNLTRLHNKVRLQELELQNKLTEVKNNTEFAKDPFKFIKSEVTKGESKRLIPSCSLVEAELFFTDRYSDSHRCDKLDFPQFIDLPQKPSHPLSDSVPPKEDFEKYIRSRRNKSSPGPDGIPFVVYKKCPQIRSRLIQILRCIWKQGNIPSQDCIASKFLVAKSTSLDVKDFRDITLFNASLKALTGVWARKIIDFMTKNLYIDTTIQKGFIPRTAGCIEHNQTLTDILKESKCSKTPFQLAFLDLENAFGSAKHNLILATLKWYNIPHHLIQLIQSLYNECYVSVKCAKWTTKPILIQIGSLQGGPEAGVLFNIPWNLLIMGIFKYMLSIGYNKISKPISGFADDLTIKSDSTIHMENILGVAQVLCEWSKCFRFKEAKSSILAIDNTGKVVDPKLKLNGKIIPSLTSKPFKFLGRWIYPSLKDTAYIQSAIQKTLNLLQKTDDLLLDGRKKCWIYQHGILPYLMWDFMMLDINTTAIHTMESHVNRFLKKWLGLTRSADPSILYRGSFGLNITNIRNAILASRTNTEIILCTSKDPLVRETAKRRRESDCTASNQNTPKRLRKAVDELEFQKKFCQFTRSNTDKRGFGFDAENDKIRVNKKSIVEKVKQMADEEKVGKVLSLSLQSDWTNWDNLIQMDLKWNEMMYGFSPSLLSFWLNSVQNTLPDPSNLRRWGKHKTADCALCKWKNCTLQHIICSCKVALEQGRISWRHDSLLSIIVKRIKESKLVHRPTNNVTASTTVKFVKEGEKVKKRKKTAPSYWSIEDDWKILMDTRQSQYRIPPEIASSNLRPDICIYSPKGRKVCFIELTSPSEENIYTWKLKKRQKYIDLVEEAKNNGFTATCRTIEIGARGFISQSSMNVFTLFGCSYKKKDTIRRELSKTAIRCSHFIWINRENPSWSNPARVCT